MDGSPSSLWFDRLIAPRVLILGVVVSFVACCLAGYLTSRRNHLQQFVRFHQMIAPESMYYPTVRQVRTLTRSQLQPDKIVVIVGGSSILHGTCQPPNDIWTQRLQTLLGDRYQVLNLALRSGRPTELGAIVAEFLERDFKKLLLIIDTTPGLMHPHPDGLMYKYFFWDAYYQGLLLPDKGAPDQLDATLAEAEAYEQTLGMAAAKKAGISSEAQRELHTEMLLNRGLFFCDLWNMLAYTRFHTLWTPMSRKAFTRPRKSFPDTDRGGLPFEIRYTRDNALCMSRIYDHLNTKCVKQAGENQWDPDPTSAVWSSLEKAATASFPEPTRKRTLVLVPWYSSYYLQQLTASQQASYAAMCHGTVYHLEHVGLTAPEVGQSYTPADYGDLVHLSASGGAKMAEAVAPQVRLMAERLGYLKEGTKR